MPTDPDLRDAELRTLFHGASAPPSSLDAASIIRRSKRRRVPQQLGAGSVLTLAVAGIGVAGFTGLRGLAPMSASDSVADGPMGVSESGPFSGAESAPTQERAACEAGGDIEADFRDGLEVASSFPATASTGQLVRGSLTLTNTGTEPVNGDVFDSMVALSRDGVQDVHHNVSTDDTSVELAPGESTTLAFAFNATACETPATPLEPGEYELSAVIKLTSKNGPILSIGGQASVITLR